MTSRNLRLAALKAPAVEASPEQPDPFADEISISLSPELRSELLDPEGWAKILATYARTMRLAVTLTDSVGNPVGPCHNPQPIWRLARDAKPERSPGCSFCLTPPLPCSAVAEALQTGGVVMAHDRASLAHVAVPLILGSEKLGALIAGQVFDRYPEPLPLQRVAREFGISGQQLWHEAIHQVPIGRATLLVYGELLAALGHAFLRERYAAILDRKLAETNRRYRLMIDGVKDYALLTVNHAGLVTGWNRGAERLLGYTESEILGRDFACFFTPEDIQDGAHRKALQRVEREGWIEDDGWRVRKDGTRFFASGVMASLGEGNTREFGKLMHDITERRNAEDTLLQAQKLESVGLLASGIAHDFNNLLTGILAGISSARKYMPMDHPARPMLEIAAESSEMAAGLTNQLLAYAGKGRFVITQIDLSGLISDMLQLIEISIPKKVDIQLFLAPDLPWIEGDASQIRQVVMNLVINGADAIGQESGTLRVSTGVSHVDGAAREVFIEVQDSGSGMSEATKAKIFDPFFTTKFTGRGLGLAAVGGIVRAHKGRLQLESAPGEGSTFRVYLPALEDHLPEGESIPSAVDVRGKGTILVVDDEAILRKVAQMVLEECGYSVLLAENGREAVEIFRKNAGNIAAVLLDMTMPVMSGDEAFQLIREIRPGVPVIFTSGYTEQVAGEHFGAGAEVSFIQKPYTGEKLGEKIRAILQITS